MNLNFQIFDAGKYYLSVKSGDSDCLIFKFEIGSEVYRYFILSRTVEKLFFLRCDVRNVKLTIESGSEISGVIVPRRGIRSFGFRARQILGRISPLQKVRRVDVRLPGVLLQEIPKVLFFQSPEAVSDNVASTQAVEENDVSSILRRDLRLLVQQESCGVVRDFAHKFDSSDDDDFIFILNCDGLSKQGVMAVHIWVASVMGNPERGDGPAWDILRANPSIGAVVGLPDDRKVVASWNRGERLEKMLEALGIDRAEAISSGRPPRCMLIRKSALVALKALNFSREDLQNGLVNESLLEAVLLTLVKSAGELVVEMPRAKPYFLQYNNVDEVDFQVKRSLNSTAGKDICLFVGLLGKSGTFSPHAVRYMRALREAGLHVFALGVATGLVSDAVDPGSQICDAFAARENEGYDFALWATALKTFPDLWSANSLLMANDSVFVAENRLKHIVDEMTSADLDVIGLTGCEMENFHLQSFFIRLNKTALDCPAVKEFWNRVVSWKDKYRIISAYEVALTAKYESAGLRCGALFDPMRKLGSRRINPSIHLWREILEEGYPFVKVQLLRDNPTNEDITGWRKLLVEKGFALDEILSQFSNEAPHAVSLLVE